MTYPKNPELFPKYILPETLMEVLNASQIWNMMKVESKNRNQWLKLVDQAQIITFITSVPRQRATQKFAPKALIPHCVGVEETFP